MKSFSNPFTLKGLSLALERLNERSERFYLALAATVTAMGYLVLGLFPLLTVIGIFKVLGGIGTAGSFGDWLGVLIWIAITATAAVVTLTMLRVKTQMPSGLGLKEDKAPRLHELLAEIGQSYKLPAIDRVIIHDHCDLDIVSVPRFGLPIMNINVLYIGLPVLQGLSPVHFKGALARKLGQFSAVHNKLTHWIYRWRQYCKQYLRTYNRTSSPLYLPLKYFFKLYTPFMNAVTVHAARNDELQGDIYALEIMNDEELADVIIRFEVCRAFLKAKYWPKIFSLLRKQPDNPSHLPHINMPSVLRKGLSENEFAQTMKDLLNTEPAWHDETPSLHARLDHLGQTKLNMPPPVMETAAQRYLGEAFSAVVKLLDKQWLAKNGKVAKKSRHEGAPGSVQKKIAKPRNERPPATQANTAEPKNVEHSEQQRYQMLLARADELDQHDAYELASLTEKFDSKVAAIARYQKILKQDPKHAATIFAVGRILLSQNDPSGVKILEKAMQLEKGCVAQACWMLAKYFKATGNDEISKKYLERAANVSAAA